MIDFFQFPYNLPGLECLLANVTLRLPPSIAPWAAILMVFLSLGVGAPALAQTEEHTLSPPIQRLPIHPGSAADEEELDLSLGESKPTAASSEAPSDCEPTVPSGAPVGVWGSLASAGSCAAKQWAKTQAPLAYAAHDQLWCSDPGSQKLLSRQKAAARAATHLRLASEREAWERGAKLRHSNLGFALGYGEMLRAQALAQRPTHPPPLPYYDPSQEIAPAWDALEAQKCKNWPSAGPELGPSLSARSVGKITSVSGSCEALLVEADMVSGRDRLSRISWLSAKCAGFASPEPAEIALAVAGGSAQAQAWQDQHFQSWRWQGEAPRSARGRSAEGF